MSADILAFLRERLDEDECTLRDALHGPIEEPWRAIRSKVTGSEYDAVGQRGYGHREPDADGMGTYVVADFGACGGSMTRYLLRFQPARLLADIESKQALLDEIVGQDLGVYGEPSIALPPEWEHVLRLLVSAYSWHPDYRPEWSPS